MNTGKCSWYLGSSKPGEFGPEFYCGKSCGWTMVCDGGEPGAKKIREYKSACPQHIKMMPEQEAN